MDISSAVPPWSLIEEYHLPCNSMSSGYKFFNVRHLSDSATAKTFSRVSQFAQSLYPSGQAKRICRQRQQWLSPISLSFPKCSFFVSQPGSFVAHLPLNHEPTPFLFPTLKPPIPHFPVIIPTHFSPLIHHAHNLRLQTVRENHGDKMSPHLAAGRP